MSPTMGYLVSAVMVIYTLPRRATVLPWPAACTGRDELCSSPHIPTLQSGRTSDGRDRDRREAWHEMAEKRK